MRNYIWHLRFWIMHCCLHREHRLRKLWSMQESERMYPVLLTVESISRYSPLLQRMPTWSRKRHLSVRLRIHWEKLLKKESIKRHSGRELIIMNSVSGRQISEVIRGDWCMDSSYLTVGYMMKKSLLSIWRQSRPLSSWKSRLRQDILKSWSVNTF